MNSIYLVYFNIPFVNILEEFMENVTSNYPTKKITKNILLLAASKNMDADDLFNELTKDIRLTENEDILVVSIEDYSAYLGEGVIDWLEHKEK